MIGKTSFTNYNYGREFCSARSCFGIECDICRACFLIEKPVKTKKT